METPASSSRIACRILFSITGYFSVSCSIFLCSLWYSALCFFRQVHTCSPIRIPRHCSFQMISGCVVISDSPFCVVSSIPSTGLYHTSGRKLFSKSTEMTGQILCNLFFRYNKKWHGRTLFFHTYYRFLYLTKYTSFSISCVSCTYLS